MRRVAANVEGATAPSGSEAEVDVKRSERGIEERKRSGRGRERDNAGVKRSEGGRVAK